MDYVQFIADGTPAIPGTPSTLTHEFHRSAAKSGQFRRHGISLRSMISTATDDR